MKFEYVIYPAVALALAAPITKSAVEPFSRPDDDHAERKFEQRINWMVSAGTILQNDVGRMSPYVLCEPISA